MQQKPTKLRYTRVPKPKPPETPTPPRAIERSPVSASSRKVLDMPPLPVIQFRRVAPDYDFCLLTIRDSAGEVNMWFVYVGGKELNVLR